MPYITQEIKKQENITVLQKEIQSLSELDDFDYVIIATGPLTSDSLSREIEKLKSKL